MLEEICNTLNNYFDVARQGGTFVVENGGIELPFLQDGQYFRIVGSVFNDGVYQYPTFDLIEETFDGAIWALAIPAAVLALADEITEWQEKNGAAAASPFISESFGGYSYTKSADKNGESDISWRSAFRSRLNQWRKIK